VVQIIGGSMEPTLPRGSRVRVVPLDGVPPLGAVLLFRAGSGDLVHRLVWSARLRGELLLFHKGDAPGRVGFAPAAAAIGRVTAILSSANDRAGAPLPVTGPPRRAYRRAQLGCRAYVLLRRLADLSGLAGRMPRALAHGLARGLLRA
jgi:hypothetical protein